MGSRADGAALQTRNLEGSYGAVEHPTSVVGRQPLRRVLQARAAVILGRSQRTDEGEGALSPLIGLNSGSNHE
jgi:hypothetical protein